jgi:hypothetical protein
MRPFLALACLAVLTVAVQAADLGPARPVKPPVQHAPNVPPAERQGGDTLETATVVELPLIEQTGTTAGFTNDYDEACPYTFSDSPDVVYTFTVEYDSNWDVDLCGSSYDTKVYIYDENLGLVACNDDFYTGEPCGIYVSKIENVVFEAGVQYFVVVDGYGGDSGDYILTIMVPMQCWIDCPEYAVDEGEPPLGEGYIDSYNSGCSAPEYGNPFQEMPEPMVCGRSGWYYRTTGQLYRDTDWFTVTVPAAGFIELWADAEQPSLVFELGPQDCENVDVVQSVAVGPCEIASMIIPGEVGSEKWVWFGPETWEDPYEFTYWIQTVYVYAVEPHTWSDVKAMFD